MPTIHLTNFIAAPPERVFDLYRSLNLHKRYMSQIKGTAVGGITSGLLGLDESVTWKAEYLFKARLLKLKITAINRPHAFTYVQAAGDFKTIRHEHFFKPANNGTIVITLFHFEIPYGVLGSAFNRYYLTAKLRYLLEQRNKLIKEYAESQKWSFILNK